MSVILISKRVGVFFSLVVCFRYQRFFALSESGRKFRMFCFLLLSLFGIGFSLNLVPYPQMLEISTRPWLYSLSQKYNRQIQRLSDIPVQEFKDIAAQGYKVVWYVLSRFHHFPHRTIGWWASGSWDSTV